MDRLGWAGIDLGGFENEYDDGCFVSVLRGADFSIEMAIAQGKEISPDVWFQNEVRHIDVSPPTDSHGYTRISAIRENIGNVDALPVQVGPSRFNYVQLMGMLFSNLKRIADLHLNQDVRYCCIAIPVFFTDIQRRAVHQAAKIAGLEPLRLLHECTAVVLAYGMEESRNLNTLEGKCVAVVNIDKNSMQICVARFISSEIKTFGKRDFEIEILGHGYNKNIGERIFEDAARERELMNGLENISTPLHDLLLEVLEEAHLKPNEIRSILLAGFGTQHPRVANTIKHVMGRNPERWAYHSAIEWVAKGCAMHCPFLMNNGTTITVDTPARIRRMLKFNIIEKFPSSIVINTKDSNHKVDTICLPKGLPSASDVVTFRTSLPCMVDLLLGTALSSSHEIGLVQTHKILDATVELRVHVDINGIDSVSAKMLNKDEGVATKACEYVAEKSETSAQEPPMPNLYVDKSLYNALADDRLRNAIKQEADMFLRAKYHFLSNSNVRLMSKDDKDFMMKMKPLLEDEDMFRSCFLTRSKKLFGACERDFKEFNEIDDAVKLLKKTINDDRYKKQIPKVCTDAEAWLKANPNCDSVAVRIKNKTITDTYLEVKNKQHAEKQAKKKLEPTEKNRHRGFFEDKFLGLRITYNLERDTLATIVDYLRMRLADNDQAEEIMGCHMLPYQVIVCLTDGMIRIEIVGKKGQRPALYLRIDSLYIIGFENKHKQIYELAPSETENKPTQKTDNEEEDTCPVTEPAEENEEEDTRSETEPAEDNEEDTHPQTEPADTLARRARLFDESIMLKCRCDYRNMVDYYPENPEGRDEVSGKISHELYKQRLIEVLNDLKLTEKSIDALWNYNGHEEQYAELLQTLTRCAIMICETSRFRIIYDAVFKNGKYDSRLLLYVIWNWKAMSKCIRTWHPSKELPTKLVEELMECGGLEEVNVKVIAEMLYLILNSMGPSGKGSH